MEDTKCSHHPQHDIIYICKTCCNYQPVCRKCVIEYHKCHDFIDVEDIDDQMNAKIRLNYYDNTLPQLNSILESCKSKLQESENHFNQIEYQHYKDFNQLETEFKQLKDIINAKEYDLKRQLLTILDENKDINIINSTICNNVIAVIDNIKKDGNNSINDIYKDPLISILKRNYQCSPFAKTINDNKDNNNNNSNNNLEKYKEIEMQISFGVINLIKDNINIMVSISNKNKSFKDKNGYYQFNYLDFLVYEDGDNIPNDIYHLAINSGHHLPPTFGNKVQSLLLPDDFNQILKNIPFHITDLYLFNIKTPLKLLSIPESITSVHFCDGFSQQLKDGILPYNIKHIYLYDTLYPLESNASCAKSIFSLTYAHKMPSHKHNIPIGFQ